MYITGFTVDSRFLELSKEKDVISLDEFSDEKVKIKNKIDNINSQKKDREFFLKISIENRDPREKIEGLEKQIADLSNEVYDIQKNSMLLYVDDMADLMLKAKKNFVPLILTREGKQF